MDDQTIEIEKLPYHEDGPYALSLARRILWPDVLEDGALARYTKENSETYWTIPKRGSVPKSNNFTPTDGSSILEVLLPIINIDVSIENKFQTQAVINDVIDKEDNELVKLINAAVPMANSVGVTEYIIPDNLVRLMNIIESKGIAIGSFLMHPEVFNQTIYWDIKPFVKTSREFREKTGIAAYFDDIPIIVTIKVSKNTVYLTAKNISLGVLPIQKAIDIDNLKAKIEENRKNSGSTKKEKITENIGLAILNDFALARLLIV